jgi:hypothetical protein
MDKLLLRNLGSDEIPLVLEKASLFGGNIAQPTLNSKIISIIRRIELNHNGTMTMKLFDQIPLENDRHISINLNYRNIHFHIDPKSFQYEGDNLIMHIPREARAHAQRHTESYVIPLNEKIPVDIYRIEKRGANGNLVASIVDVSQNGLGLLISNADEDAIVDNDHIWIKSIHGTELETPIFGRIVYVKHRRYKDNSHDTKLGISLDSNIPVEIFRKLQVMCKLVLTA